jgi:hypothetical protein
MNRLKAIKNHSTIEYCFIVKGGITARHAQWLRSLQRYRRRSTPARPRTRALRSSNRRVCGEVRENAEEEQPQGAKGLRVRDNGEMRGDGPGRPVRFCCHRAVQRATSPAGATTHITITSQSTNAHCVYLCAACAVHLGLCLCPSAVGAARPLQMVRYYDSRAARRLSVHPADACGAAQGLCLTRAAWLFSRMPWKA